MDTPIGQFLLIGNFRRRLARELLVVYRHVTIYKYFSVLPKRILLVIVPQISV